MSLNNNDGDVNKNGKTATGLNWQSKLHKDYTPNRA